jgi:YD repeat-containing protein
VVANCAYDALGRVTTLKDGSSHTLASYSYDSLDRVTAVALGNGTTETPTYDLLNRLSSLNNALSSVNRNYSYVYDNASRVTSITEPRGTIAASYDDRNEVTGITEPTGSPFADQGFTFDAGVNRATWTLGTATTSYTANNLNQYTAVGSATPTWNTDGGLHTFGGNTYTYDALGRLTEVTNSGGATFYYYDPFGRRVRKVVVDTTGPYTSADILLLVQYHYDGGQVAVE